MLINVKIPTIVDILTFMSRIFNAQLSLALKSFKTSGPDQDETPGPKKQTNKQKTTTKNSNISNYVKFVKHYHLIYGFDHIKVFLSYLYYCF